MAKAQNKLTPISPTIIAAPINDKEIEGATIVPLKAAEADDFIIKSATAETSS